MTRSHRTLSVSLLAALLHASPLTAQTPLDTGIAYSRSGMKIAGNIISGAYDFQIRLFDAETTGNRIGSIVSLTNVNVSNGVLSSQTLDFGEGAFNGEARWIDIRAKPAGSGDPYKTVGPRKLVIAVPYALALPAISVIQNATSPNIIGGHRANSVSDNSYGMTIGGGGSSALPNAAGSYFATVSGGVGNEATGQLCTVSGGGTNSAAGYATTIGGGDEHTTNGTAATVAGGSHNTANNGYASIGGGYVNVASGYISTVPGGVGNHATGDNSFAAGSYARAVHRGAFVWADDGNGATFSSAADNGFNVRASGGVRMFTSANLSTGAYLAPGGGSWGAVSDRNAKENFEPIDSRTMLDRVCAMPITRWNYKAQDAAIRHIGPMAQDFHAAFAVGEDDRHITQADADGVLFVAIQGLHQSLVERDDQIARQQSQLQAQRLDIEALQRRLLRLEQALGDSR